MERNSKRRGEMKKWQKVAFTVVAIIGGAAVIGGGIYMVLNAGEKKVAEVETGVEVEVKSAREEVITLSEGMNKILAGGTYTVTGSVENGYIYTETDDEVKIILENATIKNPEGAAIQIMGNGNTEIYLVGENNISGTMVNATDTGAVSGAIYSKADLLVDGEGSLAISSNYHGIKACDDFELKSGKIEISATEDGVNANDSIEVSGGEIAAKVGDDGLHTDGKLAVTGGEIEILESTEGLEGNVIEISDGKISVVAKDDGMNATNSEEGLSEFAAGDGELNIAGGEIYVNASGDGLDSNGTMTISGGTVYVDGPVNNGNGAMDCNGEFKITGGEVIAVGSAGMAMNATSAEQVSILVNLSGSYSGKMQIVNGSGEVILEFTAAKTFQSVLASSPKLKIGETYRVLVDGREVGSVSVNQNVTGGAGSGGGEMGPGGAGGSGDSGGSGGSGGGMSAGGEKRRL